MLPGGTRLPSLFGLVFRLGRSHKVESERLEHREGCYVKWFAILLSRLKYPQVAPFNSIAYEAFRIKWNIRSSKSSAYYAQSNGRAEAAVKSAKSILKGNINPKTGDLNTEEAVKALLT